MGVEGSEQGAGRQGQAGIRYLSLAGGHHLAWTVNGTGNPAVVNVAAWASHVGLDWTEPRLSRFYRALAAKHRLIRYDPPGIGLSDRGVTEFTIDSEVSALEAVIEESGEERVALVGRNQGGPVAITYAARHPERVSHLILFNTALRVVANEILPEGAPAHLFDAVLALVKAEWGLGSKTIAEVMFPESTPDDLAWFAEYQRSSMSPEAAVKLLKTNLLADVSAEARRVKAPTLVLHHRSSRALSQAAARRLANTISGAKLQTVEGTSLAPFLEQPDQEVAAICGFLDPASGLLSQREVEVLRAAAAGSSNSQIAKQLGVSEHTIARHLANVFLKLDVSSRSAAAARARQAGLIG